MRGSRIRLALLLSFYGNGRSSAKGLSASPGGFNNAMYCNPVVDRAIAHATTVFDRPSRARDYSFIQRQMLKDLPYYFLCQVSEIDVIPTRLEGHDRPLLSPLLQARGFTVTAVQNPLTSLKDDVAATKRAIDDQGGRVLLVGHSWAGAVITQIGTDPKVAAWSS